MGLLLDIQSELSLPEGGARIDALIRRAAALGIRGLALADRGTMAAAPAFVRAARAAGIEPRVGVRLGVKGSPGLDLLVFPHCESAWSVPATLARRGEVSPGDLAAAIPHPGSGADLLRVLAVLDRSRSALLAPDQASRLATTLALVRAAVGPGALALAVPDPRSASWLVELGRDLDLPCVIAPPVDIVEVEDALLHRLLVMIRGDHESGEGAPRPGRPATAASSLVEAASLVGPETAPEADRFFAALAVPDRFVEPPVVDLAPDDEQLPALRQRVLAAAAAERQFPPASRLDAELAAIARRQAIGPVLRLAETLRSLGDRVRIGVATGWCESWVGWVLGLTGAIPGMRSTPPAWVEGHGPLPVVELEMGEAGARAALVLLEIAGAQEPRVAQHLTAVEAARFLAVAEGHDYDAAMTRRLAALVDGRQAARERAPAGARRLVGLAVQLAGRVVGLAGDATIRVWTPFSNSGRELDRLTADATAAGGLAVRVSATPSLTLLERAQVSCRALAAAGAAPLRAEVLADLFQGPLAGRGGATFARLLRTRRPQTVADLARSLVIARRAPDAPAAHVRELAHDRPPGGMAEGAPPAAVVSRPQRPAPPERPEILFQADAWRVLLAHGMSEETARELLLRAVEGRGAPMAALRPDVLRDLEVAGRRPDLADAILAALPRIVPVLEPEGPWLARAEVLAALATLAARSPAALAAALADLFPERLHAITAWAKERQVAFLRPDLNTSAVHSEVSATHGPAGPGPRVRSATASATTAPAATASAATALVRLGLLHVPGIDRAAAEIIASIRAAEPFAGREDVVRRLRNRIPDQRLKMLLNDNNAGERGADLLPGLPAPPEPVRLPQAPVARTGRPPRADRLVRADRPGFDLVGDAMQFDLFTRPDRRPRIYTAALTRFGILRLDRAAAVPEGSRVRTVGVIRALSGLITRGGRRFAVARLEDGESGVDLLLLPALLDVGDDVPLGRPVVVDGRAGAREGKIEIAVENVIPLELLAQVVQPALELTLPAGFRRLRALKLRLLRSPGRSPVHILAPPGLRAAVEAAGLARFGVTLDENLVADMKSFVGEDHVRLIAPGRGREMESATVEETKAGAA